MSSERLPGKVLLEAKGKPLLGYVVERLQKNKNLDGIILATSVDESDNPIAEHCKKWDIRCYRGPLENVALRFIETVDQYQLDAFVRISADSPWIDPQLIDQMVGAFRSGAYDIVTNVLDRTFPKGESVEVIRTSVFKRAYPNMNRPEDFEHVTNYFYRNLKQFKIFNLRSQNPNLAKVNLCVDTQEDFNRFFLAIEQAQKFSVDLNWQGVAKIYENLQNPMPTCLN